MNNIKRLSELTIKLFSSLFTKKIEPGELWNIYNENPQRTDLDEERKLFQKIVNNITNSNPNVISEINIAIKLLHEIYESILWNNFEWNDEHINNYLGDIESVLIKLSTYRASREIDIPLYNFDITADIFSFGGTDFVKMRGEDYASQWGAIPVNALEQKKEFVLCFARTKVDGDLNTSIKNALSSIHSVLLYIRGLIYDFSNDKQQQIGILNEFPLEANKHLRIHKPIENFQIEYHAENVTMLGPYSNPLNIEVLLNQLPTHILGRIDNILAHNQNASVIENRLLDCLSWIGESTLPDALNIKYIKIATAIESLLGGELKSLYATQGSITETISERSAFVFSEQPEERNKIYSIIKKSYGKRSGIVHGKSISISQNDYSSFADIVRTLAFRYVNLLDSINTENDLQKWFLKKRWESIDNNESKTNIKGIQGI